jgi:uncharacterized repeat protein (TIGR03803 family)
MPEDLPSLHAAKALRQQTALVVYCQIIMVNKPNHLLILAVLAIPATSAVVAQTATYATLYSFQGSPSDGKSPQGGLTRGPNGALYGTTTAGGNMCLPYGPYTGECGTAFELTPPTVPGGAWTETVLYKFQGGPIDGQFPLTSMVFGSNGVLYGTALSGAIGYGCIFQLTPPVAAGASWTESVIYSFSLAWGPQGTLLLGPGGILYGTTSGVVRTQLGQFQGDGGATVFALGPPATPGASWGEYDLYRFSNSQEGAGAFPRAGLTASQGSLFGTAYLLGNTSCEEYGCGTVFAMQPPASTGSAWTEITIHQFNGAPGDGGGPLAALTAGPGGVLYGTTQYGGSGTQCTLSNVVVGCGTVFQLTPGAGGTWTETVLYSFTGQNGDGALPVASLVLRQSGSLFGTTEYGGSAASGSPCTSFGAFGCGTIFELKPPAAPGGAWTETVLHSFTGKDGDGAAPQANLTVGPTGALYGTTWAGGTEGYGTIFSIKVK